MARRAVAFGATLTSLLLVAACSSGTSTAAHRPNAPLPTSTELAPVPALAVGQTYKLGDEESFTRIATTPGGLTPDSAWARYAHSEHARINLNRLPHGSIGYYGTFTNSVGKTYPGVWGFFTPNQHPLSMGLVQPTPIPTCVEWLVTHPSGTMIEQSWACPDNR